jgi:hypothetical protein
MMASPATLTSMPRFWHSSPKIARTNAWKSIIPHRTACSLLSSRFRLRFGSKMVASLCTLERD